MDIRKNFDGKKNKICESLKKYNDRLEEVKAERKNEIKKVVLTNKALELHDSLERTMKDLSRLYEKYRRSFPDEELPILSLKTLLPDLVVAAILWCKGDKLINGVKSMMESLERLVKRLKKNPERIAKTLPITFKKEFGCLRKKIEEQKPEKPNSELQKNHDFLSQQIDERSSQVFTMGPLFVPIAFLIFAYAVTSKEPYYLGGVPLMFASLSCYLVWFMMYLRIGKLNQASYPLIHSLELMLGFSTHSSLFEIREKHRIVKKRQHVFYTAFFLLFTLWEFFLIRLTDVWNPPATEFVSPVTLTFFLFLLVLGLSLWWEPSRDRKYLLIFSGLPAVWSSIFFIRFPPPFLGAVTLELSLLWFFIIWVVWFFLLLIIISGGGWAHRKYRRWNEGRRRKTSR